jgi:hypothetical protein
MATLELPDALYDSLKQEAQRASAGDVPALLSSLLPFWQATSDPLSLRRGKGAHPEHTEDAVLAHLSRSTLVSSGTLGSLAEVFGRAANGVQGARTSSAGTYLHPFVDWVLQDSAGRSLWCTLVTVQASPPGDADQPVGVVSRAFGFLTGSGSTVRGALEHTYSDRTSKDGSAFDRSSADQLGVDLTVSPEDPAYAEVLLTAHSWGGKQQTLLDLGVRGGVLTGTGESIGNQVPSALYAISLARAQTPG